MKKESGLKNEIITGGKTYCSESAYSHESLLPLCPIPIRTLYSAAHLRLAFRLFHRQPTHHRLTRRRYFRARAPSPVSSLDALRRPWVSRSSASLITWASSQVQEGAYAPLLHAWRLPVLRRVEQGDVLGSGVLLPALRAELAFGVRMVRCSRFCFASDVLPVFGSRRDRDGLQPCLGKEAATGEEVDKGLGTVHLLHCKWAGKLWSFGVSDGSDD